MNERANPFYDSKVNKNLLDNWYFKNPVNQRNLTTANAGGGKLIDRWRIYSYTTGSATLSDDGITLDGSFDFGQCLEVSRVPNGVYVTISALFSDGTLHTFTDKVKTDGSNQYIGGTIENCSSVFLVKNWSTGTDLFYFHTLNKNAFTVVAVKLELGKEQTLCHQEDGKWVLNEVPKYNEQFIVCQRYYQKLVVNYTFRSSGSAAGVLQLTFPQMRANPTVTLTGTDGIKSQWTQINAVQVSTGTAAAGTVYVSTVELNAEF